MTLTDKKLSLYRAIEKESSAKCDNCLFAFEAELCRENSACTIGDDLETARLSLLPHDELTAM
jgi:hypothetical protein